MINHNKLHDYLIAHLPGFSKTFINDEGINEAYRDSGSISKIGPTITIEAPDEVSRSALETAIASYQER